MSYTTRPFLIAIAGLSSVAVNVPRYCQRPGSIAGALKSSSNTAPLVADTRSVRGNAEVFGGPLPAGCLSALGGFVTEHPKQCQAVVDGMVHALKWLQTAGPSDLIKTLPEKYFRGGRALYLAAFSRARESWAPDGVMPEAGPQTVVRLLAHFDAALPLQRVDLAHTFTNEFARVAKARFRA